MRWKGNNIVTVSFTVFRTESIKKVLTWSRKEKKKIDVDRPYIVKRYNKTMGGQIVKISMSTIFALEFMEKSGGFLYLHG